MTSFILRRQLTVEFAHCDPAGVVSPQRVFEYFDTGTWMLFEAALAIRRGDFIVTHGILPLVDVRASYRKPLKFGDLVEINSRVSAFRRSSFDVEHRIMLDGELAVEGAETRVWAVKDEDDPSKIRARAIPADIIARFN